MINWIRLVYLRRRARYHRDRMKYISARLGHWTAMDGLRHYEPCGVDRARLVSPYFERLYDQLGVILDEIAWRTEQHNDRRRLRNAQKRNRTD